VSGFAQDVAHERRLLTDWLRVVCFGAVMVRLEPDGTVTAYGQEHRPVRARDERIDPEIAARLRAHFSGVDWTAAHDYNLGAGVLNATPRPGQPGADPPRDGTFGTPRPPRLLRRGGAR
jgi:hypothetical protein